MGRDQVPGILAAGHPDHQLEEFLFEDDDPPLVVLMLPDEPPEMVDVYHQHQVGHREVVMQVTRPPLHVGLVAIGPVEEVVDQLPAHPVLGLRHLPLLDHLERKHRGGVLDRHQRQVLMMLGVVDDRQVAKALGAGQYRCDDPGRGQAMFGEGRYHAGAPTLDHLFQHGLDGGGPLHV